MGGSSGDNEISDWISALAANGTKGNPWASVPSGSVPSASTIPVPPSVINSFYEAMSKTPTLRPIVPLSRASLRG
jgi:hypothetical protein